MKRATDLTPPAAKSAGGGSHPRRYAETTYSIGALADELGLTTRAIRFYEARGLISPSRAGAHRSYTRRDRARLMLVVRAKNLGFTLEDVAEYLALYDADPHQEAQTKHLLAKIELTIAELEGKRADLDRTLTELAEIRQRCIDHLDGTR
jgi:DNA-binding transcriptional MerR regulator